MLVAWISAIRCLKLAPSTSSVTSRYRSVPSREMSCPFWSVRANFERLLHPVQRHLSRRELQGRQVRVASRSQEAGKSDKSDCICGDLLLACISSPFGSSPGCRQLVSKVWDRGKDSRLGAQIQVSSARPSGSAATQKAMSAAAERCWYLAEVQKRSSDRLENLGLAHADHGSRALTKDEREHGMTGTTNLLYPGRLIRLALRCSLARRGGARVRTDGPERLVGSADAEL